MARKGLGRLWFHLSPPKFLAQRSFESPPKIAVAGLRKRSGRFLHTTWRHLCRKWLVCNTWWTEAGKGEGGFFLKKSGHTHRGILDPEVFLWASLAFLFFQQSNGVEGSRGGFPFLSIFPCQLGLPSSVCDDKSLYLRHVGRVEFRSSGVAFLLFL